MGAKDQLGHRVWTLTQTFVLWSEQMSALDKKNKPAGYRCVCVIHNFSYTHGIEPPDQLDQKETRQAVKEW
jgi:hypothetical protein